MSEIKHLTLLHSNDLHGDFLCENVDEKLIGGVSLLSGYINMIKNDRPALYAIAGDMFRGSVIDSEFKGMSTIEIMNLLTPDIVTLGNHEIDYGLAHLVFLEKVAKFPIVNANLYIKNTHTRLFNSHKIIEIDGIKVMFIGIITDEIMSYAKQDAVLGSFVNLEEASREVEKIINSYKGVDIDLTVLLTHIGFENDKELAKLLSPELGVDLIIGGHSHTFLEHPEEVNGILIAQAGTGTDQIGKFELDINMDTNSVENYQWDLVPINNETCPTDDSILDVLTKYTGVVDQKFGRIVTRFSKKLTHPVRYQETALGNLFADILKDALSLDIMLLGSGSVRGMELGPIVTFGNLTECFPYDDWVYNIYPNGKQLRQMITYLMRDPAFTNDTEFYQFSKGLRSVYNYETKTLESLTFNGEEVQDDKLYSCGVQKFHFQNFNDFFGVDIDEISKNAKTRIAATSCMDVLNERLSQMERVDSEVEGRIIVKGLENYPVEG